MNKLYKYIFLLILIVTSCTKDESSPFTGTDAHIVSFAIITSDGVKYPAEIAGNDMIVTIPFSVNLSGATAEYKLCENNKIMPDPSAIDNWNNEQVFRIEAYNGTFDSYSYRIVRQDIINDGNITLNSQAELVQFAEKKINVIEGNLIIGAKESDDPIVNLEPLENLKEVKFNIVIKQYFKSLTTEGLTGLIKAGGIYIGSENEKMNTATLFSAAFPALKEITNINIYSDSVSSVIIPALTKAENVFINGINIKNLELNSLSTVTNNITLKGLNGSEYTEPNSNLKLNIISLPKLNNVEGNFVIENLWRLQKIDLPKLNNVAGDFELKYIRTIEDINFPSLVNVNGFLNIMSNDGLVSLSASKLVECGKFYLASVNNYSINLKKINFSSLKTCNGDFKIMFFGGEKIEFKSLEHIEGTVYISQMQFLEQLIMPSIKYCKIFQLIALNQLNSDIDLSKIENLATLSIENAPKITKIKTPSSISGDLTLTGDGKATSGFPVFEGLESVGGKFNIKNFATEDIKVNIKVSGSIVVTSSTPVGLIKTFSFPNLETVGVFDIQGINSLTHLSAPKLTQAKTFTLKGGYVLTNIDLPLLQKVEGNFTFYGGSYQSAASKCVIENLNGFAALKSAAKVDVRYCSKLNDFTGLKNVIESLSTSTWNVQGCLYNPTWQQMKDGNYTL